MYSTDPENSIFNIAAQYINFTNQNIFLTGKAGSGKTTFLHYIKNTSNKRMVVVAPTGVAAINAGGSTIHSFFQMPLGSFIPENINHNLSETEHFFSKQYLLKHLKLNKTKRDIIKALDLLVIDEVSMVRADLLDAVEVILKHVRQRHWLPFGGVQMLFIGDLSQLPPVVKDNQWRVLERHYKGPFFFHAHSLQQAPPMYLELKKIYRQTDRDFIRLLNNIRHNQATSDDLQLLNSYYKPAFVPDPEEKYIILTSHNAKADQINQSRLNKLEGKSYTFKADIEGNFSESAYPAEPELVLKKDAQIMFIRNDMSEVKRYYNGKIGVISNINGEHIEVTFPGEGEPLVLEKTTWENQRYEYKEETEAIETKTIGEFSQYPIRLAWAITIHKSQGLTFEKAIIDAGKSFAPGQVYVALSRLTSLQGLILYSKIEAHNIMSDRDAESFAQSELAEKELQEHLQTSQKTYIHNLLVLSFDWEELLSMFSEFEKGLENRKIPDKEEAEKICREIISHLQQQKKIADKFIPELKKALDEAPSNGYEKLHQRIENAFKYYDKELKEKCWQPLKDHLEDFRKKSQTKKYVKNVHSLLQTLLAKKDLLQQTVLLSNGLVQQQNPMEMLQKLSSRKKEAVKTREKEMPRKPARGETKRISLEMFQQGKSIEEIAEERKLVPGTIESHLASFISSGEVIIDQLVTDEKREMIEKVIAHLGEEAQSGEIKEKLGAEFSYGEIKAVLAHRQAEKERIS